MPSTTEAMFVSRYGVFSNMVFRYTTFTNVSKESYQIASKPSTPSYSVCITWTCTTCQLAGRGTILGEEVKAAREPAITREWQRSSAGDEERDNTLPAWLEADWGERTPRPESRETASPPSGLQSHAGSVSQRGTTLAGLQSCLFSSAGSLFLS